MPSSTHSAEIALADVPPCKTDATKPAESVTNVVSTTDQTSDPAEWRGQAVPDILLSGNTPKIEEWRHDQALARTQARRPDLLA